MRLVFLIFAILVTLPLSVSPSSAAGKKGGIELTYTRNDGASDSVIYKAVSVDGKVFWGTIPQGRHSYRLMADFYRAWVHYRAFVVVTATLDPNRKYRVDGDVGKTAVKMWIVDAKSGKRISPIGTVKYVHCGHLSFRCEDGSLNLLPKW